jgi:hypothetical protein
MTILIKILGVEYVPDDPLRGAVKHGRRGHVGEARRTQRTVRTAATHRTRKGQGQGQNIGQC